MKIFISAIDSQLGFHLTETLRQDHLLLQGYPLISGTLSQSQPFALHDSIYQTFNFSQERDLTVKNAIDSDILIFDIRNDPAPQIQFILKVLKHYNRQKPLKLIAVSNFMTWSNVNATQFTDVPHDKQALLEYALSKEKWRQTALKRQNYPLRVPHPIFVYNYLLEEQIMQLKYHQPLIQPLIICTGVLYGKSGMDLKRQIQTAINCSQSPLMKLKRNRQFNLNLKLPVLNVDKLLKTIEQIVYPKQVYQKIQAKEYTVLCQDQTQSVIDIVENLHQLCGHMEYVNEKIQQHSKQQLNSNSIINDQNLFMPELIFSNDKPLLSLSTSLSFQNQPNKTMLREKEENIVSNLSDQWINRSQYKQQSLPNTLVDQKPHKESNQRLEQALISEFLNYYDIEFKHYILPEQIILQFTINQQKSVNQSQQTFSQGIKSSQQSRIVKSLLKKYLLLDKNQLSQTLMKLIQSGQIPQERLTTPQEQKKKLKSSAQNQQKLQQLKKQPYQMFFPEIIKHFLTRNLNSNFLICLKHQLIIKLLALLNESDFQTFNHLKFILIDGKKSNSIIENTSFPNERLEKTIEIFSEEFFSTFNLKTIQNSSVLQILSSENSVQNPLNTIPKVKTSKDQLKGSEQAQINLASQYLLDNLVVYLAEAKQQLKIKGNLKMGQKFEGKQNIKLFIQELKKIRERQQSLENEEEEEKGC